MLRAFLNRRRVQRTLAQYVSPDVAREIVGGSVTAPPVAQRAIQFAFVAISSPDATHYSERVGAVADAALARGAVVQCLIPIVAVGFGVLDAASPGDRAGFIADLQSQFADAAVVHGRVAAVVRTFGSDSRLDTGFWWPGMVAALQDLASLSPGQVHEVH